MKILDASSSPSPVWNVIAWACGVIIAVAGALAAIPRICTSFVQGVKAFVRGVRAFIGAVRSTARLAGQIDAAMPLVLKLPSLVDEVNRKIESHRVMLEGQNATLERQDTVLAEIKQKVCSHEACPNRPDQRPRVLT